ncbi:oligoendopeptidase F [Granulicatella seriolae]|uniref:Oligopeptidase F n=1 Tax=Granulicatella seriolae TaxID=2967226 RepID=A0ABT1WKR3_9LACT|nr:oligoendopeptidase F [Granulicatella seriolae]
MTNDHKLLKRSEVPEELTWDLTTIYADDQEFDRDLQAVKDAIPELAAYQGKVHQSSKDLLDYIEKSLEAELLIETAYVYSHLKNDQDTGEDKYQVMNQKALAVYTELEAAMAWFEPELLEIEDAHLEAFYVEQPELKVYKTYLDALRVQKGHVLDGAQEALLAEAGDVLRGSGQTFALLNNADLKFGKITTEDGQEVELTHGNYSTFIESSNPQVRKAAFETIYKRYMELKNTFASTLGNNIKVDNFNAKAHKYPSARNAAMSKNQIPEEVYDTLVGVVNENLPLLHRYLALQQKALGLEEMHMYDLHTPITGKAPFNITYEEAVQETFKALAPLGEDYLAILQECFDNRWIDVLENEGKRSGGYSSGGYATSPYILLNWQDDLSNFFTLVHELGHSVHSYLTRKNQPFVYGNYSIFLAEIASTTNENLLTEYLLNKYTDEESQKYILNSYLNRVKSTIFRQTQFAEFEHLMHTAAQEGTPLTQDFLAKTYAELNERYYKPVVQDPEIAYEWARIPHFYMNYYVYQYSTGMAAAIALSQKILTEGKPALDAYLAYLSAGRSDKPIEIMKKAGVDMTKADYLNDSMKVFEARLQQLEDLMK